MTGKRKQPCPCGSGKRYKKCCGLIERKVSVEDYLRQGKIAFDQGDLEEAEAKVRKALTMAPDHVEAHINLGIILDSQGKLDEAAASYRQGLSLNPNIAEAYSNLGVTLNSQGKFYEAETCYRRALELMPDYADIHLNLGTTLNSQDKLREAETSFREAIKLRPDLAEAFINLGNNLKDQGKLDEAISCYRKALEIKPESSIAYGNMLFCMNYHSKILQEEIFKESLKFGKRLMKGISIGEQPYTNSFKADRSLRVGYVSPDFRKHSVAFFIEPVIRAHNRIKVEVFCYSGVFEPDEVTQRLQEEADHWYSTVGMKPQTLADRIRKDKIDILVDLAGYTCDLNPLIFALKPAPIQITWLGYPNTTGLEAIDYRLTDRVTDPEGEADRFHSEKLIRLEHGFLCYQPVESAPEVSSLPGMDRGYITFGSFNNLSKVTPSVIKVWIKILHAVPDSHLLLKAKQFADNEVMKHFKKMFTREGISEDRLEIYPKALKLEDHLAFYNKVDIGLDPFPYNGTTTTCEALWMGVPVVTLLGNRHASRVGASILHRIGLDELIAQSVEEYVDLARSLALNRKQLQEMRFSLRNYIRKSELMNSEMFVNQLEEVYRQMWINYCKNSDSDDLKKEISN